MFSCYALLEKILTFPGFLVPDNVPAVQGQVFSSALKVINIFRFKKRKNDA